MDDYCDAILKMISKLDDSRHIQITQNGLLIPNHNKEIMIDEENDLYVKLIQTEKNDKGDIDRINL